MEGSLNRVVEELNKGRSDGSAGGAEATKENPIAKVLFHRFIFLFLLR